MYVRMQKGSSSTFREVIPKHGLLYSDESYAMTLCKPKILPLKSVTLEKLETMQKRAQEAVKLQEQTALTGAVRD